MASLDWGMLIWSSSRPILKLFSMLGMGYLAAKNDLLTPMGQKAIANLLIWVTYPCLVFANMVVSIDTSQLKQMGLLVAASVFYVGIGWGLGLVLRKVSRPPVGFQNTFLRASSCGNWGDLTLAMILSLGNSSPFKPGDASLGVA
ncbi:hypothetical protein HK104_001912 [Borealophlyctis nickersoniae]|nr:hypothetical protein HK104_001912 [Borealophlyctis nickersoniae]